jgi:O-methyltransferase
MGSTRQFAQRTINHVLRHAGLELRAADAPDAGKRRHFPDVEPWVAAIIDKVRPFTMTSEERISSLCHAVRYIVRANIPGDIVECGVWRGGSTMAAALALIGEGDTSRTLHLFDTFTGMTPPTDADRAAQSGVSAAKLLETSEKSSYVWAYASIDEVRANLASVQYPASRVRLVEGKVEDTIPAEAPSTIALLRLDTDWYESTRHELIHLYPRLALGGVLIIDDYGFWEGARKAVDEYIGANRLPILLNRIDDTGRIAVKYK